MPFKLNENILNYVIKITNQLSELRIHPDLSKVIYLRITSKIKSVNSSCAIESNTLNENQIVDIINGEYVLLSPKEINKILKKSQKAF